ncbi:MAG: hypothetical protein M3P85_00180 [Actinomycetota bacterium]|nr:hypothetical protein [Actinomycetota bacterium]
MPEDHLVEVDMSLKRIAETALDSVQLSMQRALAHHAGAEVSLPTDEESVELATVRLLKKYDPNTLKAAATRAALSLPEAPAIRSGTITLKDPTPVLSQIRSRPVPPIDLDGVARMQRQLTGVDFQAKPIKVPDLRGRPSIVINPKPQPSGSPIDQALERPGVKAALGDPTGPELAAPGGRGRLRNFEGGAIYWTEQTGAHEVHGAIFDRWRAAGGHGGELGFPLTDETTTPDTIGKFNHFEGGSIYWTKETGAHEVHGQIYAKWAELGWETGYLAYPTTDVTDTPDGRGSFSHFQGGSIYYSQHRGANAINVSVRNGWERQGWEQGFLGYPMGDTIEDGGVLSNLFEGGTVRCAPGAKAEVDAPFDVFRFRLHRVFCNKMTSGMTSSDDDMVVGGTAIDDTGTVGRTGPFPLGGFNQEARDKPQNPPLRLARFELAHSPTWPKFYFYSVILCEEDSGGYVDDLRVIAAEVTKYVKEALEKASKQAIEDAMKQKPDPNKAVSSDGKSGGATAGAGIGAAAGGAVGAAIGLVVGWILGGSA